MIPHRYPMFRGNPGDISPPVSPRRVLHMAMT